MRIRWLRRRRNLYIVPAVHGAEEPALPVFDGPFIETKELSLAGEPGPRGFRLPSPTTPRASCEVLHLSAARKWHS
jgi:hypothetical protein